MTPKENTKLLLPNLFLKLFTIFISCFIFFGWLQNSPSFADPDSFYHAKIIWLMKDKIMAGELPIFDEFPWLYFTVLKDNYIDHHFLYHLLSIPLVFFGKFFSSTTSDLYYEILAGFKFATILWASSFIVWFYFILKKIDIKGAIYYTTLLALSNPFIFRLNLGKASALSLIFIFAGIYFCLKNRLLPLFFISFFYVWLYGGWPLILLIVVIYIFSNTIALFFNIKQKNIIYKSKPIKPSERKHQITKRSLIKNLKLFFCLLFNHNNFKLIITTISGLLAGLVINPYFPKNLLFYYHQIYQIVIINYKDKLNVGGEWYSYGWLELLQINNLVVIFLIPAIWLCLLNIYKYYKKDLNQDPTHLIFSFILAIIFLILTLRARRNIEYFIPFLIFFIAHSYNESINNFSSVKIRDFFKKNKSIAIFLILIIYFSIQNINTSKQELTNNTYHWSTWKNASLWLKNNTAKNEIITNSDWDDWPFLFFYNDDNYYIVGLDPTFMYKYDETLYNNWSDATLGQYSESLNKLFSQDLSSKYILLDDKHQELEHNLDNNINFEQVFDNNLTKIYKYNNSINPTNNDHQNINIKIY